MDFITVEQAENIIQSQAGDFGNEKISFEDCVGRVLAEDLFADRDLPPFNRPTVDGIAINFGSYQHGIHSFKIKATQAAGEIPKGIDSENECVEIMTGAALHGTVDTVIRYEDILIKDRIAVINIPEVKEGQNIHSKGKDKRQGEKVVDKGRIIDAPIIGLAASIGRINLLVKKLPKVLIVTTGDEMVGPEEIPADYQLRRSNDYTIKASLKRFRLNADTLHLQDDKLSIKNELNHCLKKYDVILMSGGVSMGKYDYVPNALRELSAVKLFHKVRQRPGKPFWFGKHREGTLVFALPGNPVSAFMCLHRYFIPWLKKSLQIHDRKDEFAILDHDISFPHPLQYFVQVKLTINERGEWLADPLEGHGSGDFTNLSDTDCFMELPLEKDDFKKGEVYRIWRYL